METIAHHKVQILFLAANPEGTDKMALDKEIRTIKEKIRASRYRDQLDLVSAWAVRFDDLLQELNEHEAQIVHFSGHGSPTGEIILVGDDGVAGSIDPNIFRDLIETTSDNIRVVILNACYSEPMAVAVEEIVDCAIGTKGQLGDKAAIAFAGSFYRAIGFGRSVWNAFRQGLISVRHCNIYGHDVPQLLHRKSLDFCSDITTSKHIDN